MPQRIIRLLGGKDEFVSGEKISSELGITRTAVWKKIKLLRKDGFIIKAVPSRGYKLIKTPDLSTDDILAHVKGVFWKDVVFYHTVDSTNETASALSLRSDIQSGTVIVADAQTKGRGRLGRTWVSPPGMNIYMSIILRPEIRPGDATLLTVLAAVACANALREQSGLHVSLKWPNDLVVSDKKTGGILTEVRSDPDRIHVAIIGIGINVNCESRDFPDDIRPIATSLKVETGKYQARSGLIIRILEEFEAWYKALEGRGRRPLLEEWKRLSSTLNRNVKVTMGKETISGLAEDIDEEGMLIVRLSSGTRKRISAGDLTILR